MIDKRSFAIGARSSIAKGGGSGTTDYEALTNKPSIHGETLSGNKTAADLGLVEAEAGKGLSTNDFTDERKNKLDGMEAQANKTLIDDTLSNAGQAADAKASGDAIASLQSETALLRELIDGIDAPIYRTTGPGNPLTFSDGYAANVKELAVTLAPTQEGEGAPYPPGGGPNLIARTTGSVQTSSDITFTHTDNGILINGSSPAGSAPSCIVFRSTLAAGTYTLTGTPSAGPDIAAVVVYRSDTNATVAQVDAKNITFQLSEQTEVYVRIFAYGNYGVYNNFLATFMLVKGTAVPSRYRPYSNIRPISGVSSVGVTRTGKNLLKLSLANYKARMQNGSWNGNTFTYNGLTATFDVDAAGWVNAIQVRGTASSAAFLQCPNPMARLPGGKYTLSGGIPGGSFRTYLLYLENVSGEGRFAPNEKTTFSESEDWMFSYLTIAVYAGTTIDFTFRPMLRLASETDDTFEPYQGQSVTVSMGEAGTVYGGTLDVTTGKLTVTHGVYTFTGEEEWTIMEDRLAWMRDPTFAESVLLPDKITDYPDILCEALTPYPYASIYGKLASGISVTSTYIPSYNGRFAISMDIYNAREHLTGTKIVYRLSNPVTYQLTGQDLATLSGYNVVFTDADSVAVQYRADPTLAYEELENNLTNAILSLGANF